MRTFSWWSYLSAQVGRQVRAGALLRPAGGQRGSGFWCRACAWFFWREVAGRSAARLRWVRLCLCQILHRTYRGSAPEAVVARTSFLACS
jgi:hypothetical protein